MPILLSMYASGHSQVDNSAISEKLEGDSQRVKSYEVLTQTELSGVHT